MQVCTSLQTDNHAGTPPLSFLQAGCPSCRPTNSVKALKALSQALTEYYRENADEAAESGAGHAEKPGPATTERSAVHQVRSGDVRRNLDRAGDESVEVDVSVQSSRVERHGVVDHTAREPAHDNATTRPVG